MSWRLHRYVIKEILPYFLLTLLVVTTIIFAKEVGRFSELFVKRNVPPALVRTLLMAVLTRIFIITLPISLLMGMLLGLARMSSDNEIVSMLAGGLSRKQLVIPLLGLSALVSLLLGFLTLVELPHSATRFREIRSQLIIQGIRTQIKPRVFDTRFVNRVLYIRDIDRKTDRWEGIFLASSEGGSFVFMTGREGILELGDRPESSELHLFDGVAHRLGKSEDGTEVYRLEGFSSYHVRFDPQSREAAEFQLEAQRQPEPIEEKSLGELMRISSKDQKQYIKARVEASRRVALPFACLLFAPIGLAIGVLRKPAGRSVGFILGITLATAYYLLLFGGERLARAGLLPPLSAMWLANLVFAPLGALGLLEHRPLQRWQDLVFIASNWLQKLQGQLKARQRRVSMLQTSGIWRWLPQVKLIDQYLVTDFLRFFLLSLVSLWGTFMVFTLFELSPDLIEHQISMADLMLYFLFLSPQVMQSLSPPCILIASLLVISILKRTNQIEAIKSTGLSTYRISAPILLTCLGLVVITSAWENWVVPGANVRQDQLRFLIKKGRFPSPVELSPMLQDGNWIYGKAGRLFHFERFNWEHDEFQLLWILDLDQSDMTIHRRVEATRAVWDKQRSEWVLERGRAWIFKRDRLIKSETFDEVRLKLEEKPAYFKADIKKPEYMSASELAAHIIGMEQSGFDATELRMALTRKFARPVACFIMGLVGVPFGFTLGRRGALYGVGLGVSLGLVYWIGLEFFEELGRYSYVRPWLAAWGPDGLFGVLGGYFLFRVRS